MGASQRGEWDEDLLAIAGNTLYFKDRVLENKEISSPSFSSGVAIFLTTKNFMI